MALSRNLRDYKWELLNNKTVLTDKRADVVLSLDKVRLMSFIKFAPNVLDKMRIDEGKKLREIAQQRKMSTNTNISRLKKSLTENNKQVKELKAEVKKLKAQAIKNGPHQEVLKLE